MARIEYLAHINLNKNELQNAVIQPLGTAPSAPNLGQIYYDTASTPDVMRQWDGTAWQPVGGIYTHPNHTGDVQSVGDGATTIVNKRVTLAKLADMPANTVIGTVSAGTPVYLTKAQLLTLLNVSEGAQPNVNPTISYTPTELVVNSTLNPGSSVVSIPAATTTAAGVMTKADKVKLDGLVTHSGTNLGNSTTADIVTVTSSTGTNTNIPAANINKAGVMTAAQVILLNAALSVVNLTTGSHGNTNLTIANSGGTDYAVPMATAGSLAGLISGTDKAKLDGLVSHIGTNLVSVPTTTSVKITSSTGNDATILVATTSRAGVMDKTMFDKLAGIENLADVTDTGNVTAAGAVMKSMASTSGFNFVSTDATFTGSSNTKLASQLAIKTYVDQAVSTGNSNKGGYDIPANAPDLTGSGTSVAVNNGDTYTIVAGGTFHGHVMTVGDTLIADVTKAAGTPLTEPEWTYVINTITYANTTVPGLIRLSTEGEVTAGTEGTEAVTPALLQKKLNITETNQSVSRKVILDCGNTAQQTLTHNLNSQFVSVSLYDSSTPWSVAECEVRCKSVNTVELLFNVAPASGKYKVVIIG